MSSVLRRIIPLVKSYSGITVDRVVEGNHYKLFLTTPAGKQILVVSRTTSDSRALANNKALLRRWSQGEMK